MSPSDPNTPGDSNPTTNPAGDGVEIGGRSAAQARTGTRTFTILVISLCLVVVAFAAAYAVNAYYKGSHPVNGGAMEGIGKDSTQAATFHTSDTPSAKQNPPGNPGGS